MEHGPDILVDAVAEAFSGHRCASAWLGYGNVLFLGFGGAPIEPFTPAGQGRSRRTNCTPTWLTGALAGATWLRVLTMSRLWLSGPCQR